MFVNPSVTYFTHFEEDLRTFIDFYDFRETLQPQTKLILQMAV